MGIELIFEDQREGDVFNGFVKISLMILLNHCFIAWIKDTVLQFQFCKNIFDKQVRTADTCKL